MSDYEERRWIDTVREIPFNEAKDHSLCFIYHKTLDCRADRKKRRIGKNELKSKSI